MEEEVSNPRRMTTDLVTTQFLIGFGFAAPYRRSPERAVESERSRRGPTIACGRRGGPSCA